MKAKNHVIRSDEATLRRLKSEYDFIGRECAIQGDKLVVFALPQNRKKKEKNDKSKRR